MTAINVPRPQITTGPPSMTVDHATALYLRQAAGRVRRERYWGSGVTALVSKLLDDAADALETTTPAAPRTTPDPHIDTPPVGVLDEKAHPSPFSPRRPQGSDAILRARIERLARLGCGATSAELWQALEEKR